MQPEDVTFFVDRSLGSVKFPTALRERGLRVIAHDDRFAPDTPDHVWLRQAGTNDWIVLTKDARIRYRRIEQQAYLGSGVRAFVFSQGNQTMEIVIASFWLALDKILRTIERVPPPFVANITSSGIVKVLAPDSKRTQ